LKRKGGCGLVLWRTGKVKGVGQLAEAASILKIEFEKKTTGGGFNSATVSFATILKWIGYMAIAF